MNAKYFYPLLMQFIGLSVCFSVKNPATFIESASVSRIFSLDKTVGTGVADVTQSEWKGDKCLRHCTVDTPSRICYFSFTLEHYQIMGA